MAIIYHLRRAKQFNLTLSKLPPTDRLIRKGCQEKKPNMKRGNVTGFVTTVSRKLNSTTIVTLTGAGSREDRYEQSEDDTGDVCQHCGSCSSVAVHPRLGFGLLVVDHG